MTVQGEQTGLTSGAMPWGWFALGAALVASVAAVWFASGLALLTVAYAGGLATLIILGVTLYRLRPAPVAQALAPPDWSVTVKAIERPDTGVAITDKANRLVCASSLYVAQFGENLAPPNLQIDPQSQEALLVAAREAWRDGEARVRASRQPRWQASLDGLCTQGGTG